MKEIYEGVTLKNVRETANEGKKLLWENGLLKHKMDGKVRELWVRVAVPTGRFTEVMRLAHNLP